ncbi:MAG: hypothetical protein M3N22_11680, partial [Acidobacteriota bacterium]|nr:hypothetical protein [Acidobacteriota bacterium]
GFMQAKSWLKLSAILPTLLFAALPIISAAQDPSQQSASDPVADAARRSREAKQKSAKPRKVYTDDDLPRRSDSTSAPAPSAASETVPAASNDAATITAPAAGDANAEKPLTAADREKHQEAEWRKRFQDQRDKIARAEKELDILQRETQKARIQYYPDPQKTMTEQYTRKDINEKDAKIEAKRQEIAQLKQGLSDMEDELHKAGGDQGWSR